MPSLKARGGRAATRRASLTSDSGSDFAPGGALSRKPGAKGKKRLKGPDKKLPSKRIKLEDEEFGDTAKGKAKDKSKGKDKAKSKGKKRMSEQDDSSRKRIKLEDEVDNSEEFGHTAHPDGS